ncbi:MAG: hypothetical protein Q4F23_06345 [Coriobacteriia bacterium]|nr:hypothetical protein [Coriobacteriia bacterium]
MDQYFFDMLYSGYTGEYQLMSSLYRNGLDALRPPADMGIDVVSLNLKQQLREPGTIPETFFFQVKTAVTSVSEDPDRPGAIATVEFKLKDTEVDLLAHSRERALFCYVYNVEAGSLTDAFETPFLCFWLDGTLIKKINDAGAFFRKDGEPKLTLACQLRKPTHEYGHWYALVVDGQGANVEDGYLGVVGGSGYPADDGADHYSVAGFLEYARQGR